MNKEEGEVGMDNSKDKDNDKDNDKDKESNGEKDPVNKCLDKERSFTEDSAEENSEREVHAAGEV